jgi:DNA-binding SARP family transcriptional activator/Tfp pilus assembly protein PilF
MEFLLLGPLVVRRGGDVVPVQRGKQRTLLAALLLQANQVVEVDELLKALWDKSQPPSAQVTLQNYVKRLRQALGDGDRSLISTQPRGYQVRAASDELDLSRFQELLSAAQSAARNGSWPAAARQASGALALWRGNPLADVESQLLVRRDVPRLAELRLQAQETRINAELRLGRQAELVDELRQLTAAHPLRERYWGLLMLALSRSGRQADALATYRKARTVLVNELGSEPGAALRAVHQRVLAGDFGADAEGRAGLAGSGYTRPGYAQSAVPRQLPAPVSHFTGRTAELVELNQLASQAGEHGPVLISAIGGAGGVGKTALAVHWAHQVTSRFPDGQLYVNLRGYDPGPPVRPGDVLAGFLRALGVPGQEIPADDDERAARYRSLLAGRRMLVVLDNASDVEQVRPLLPGAASCVTVVTSRDSLSGLVIRDGARRVGLGLLPPADAVGLLRDLIGVRADADPAAAEALAGQCCRLPLALRVAAELAASRPEAPLADLVTELADQQRRLDLLEADGDPRTAVRAIFSWSYQYLDPPAARAFRLLGLHPGPDWDPFAAAALTGSTLAQARALLNQLALAHLVQPAGRGRLAMHDLLRAYAAELADREDSEPEQRQAVTLLLDYYLQATAAAMDALFPGERHRRPRVPAPAGPAPQVTDAAAARAWLETERASLVTATGHAAQGDWSGHATRLAHTLFRYLDVGGYYAEAATVHGNALQAARRAGDRAAEGTAWCNLGAIGLRQGDSQRALGDYDRALALFREVGDATGQARALSNLGSVEVGLCRYQEAAAHLGQSCEQFRAAGDQVGLGLALIGLGLIGLRQGHYDLAASQLREAVAAGQAVGDCGVQADALDNLGVVELAQGRYEQSADYIRKALAVARQHRHRFCEAHALADLGRLEVCRGRYDHAARHLRQALALTREIGERQTELEVLGTTGELLIATGRPDEAMHRYAVAAALAVEIGDAYEEARARDGLGHAHHTLGNLSQARRHWQEALQRYARIGSPAADQIRDRLSSQDGTAFPAEPEQPAPDPAATV